MIRRLDFKVITTIIWREASLSLKNLGTHLTLLVLAVGMLFLSRKSFGPSSEQFGVEAESLITAMFLFVSLSIVIMMNSTLVGASITDERDNRIIEILLSSCRPEELYIGKLVGHSMVGFGQILLLWGIVVASLVSVLPSTPEEFPWFTAIIILLFFLPGYLFFSSLHAIIDVLVSRNEDYTFAQIPVLVLLLISLAVPFAPIMDLGDFTGGWLLGVSWIPPLSMGAAPLVRVIGDGSNYLLMVSWVLILIASFLAITAGGKIFRHRVLV